eukprot:355259-Chlamydomonas_euryale.AAC.1
MRAAAGHGRVQDGAPNLPRQAGGRRACAAGASRGGGAGISEHAPWENVPDRRRVHALRGIVRPRLCSCCWRAIEQRRRRRACLARLEPEGTVCACLARLEPEGTVCACSVMTEILVPWGTPHSGLRAEHVRGNCRQRALLQVALGRFGPTIEAPRASGLSTRGAAAVKGRARGVIRVGFRERVCGVVRCATTTQSLMACIGPAVDACNSVM